MATQGVLSIVDSHWEVCFKIITGCDGYRMLEVAQAIMDSGQKIEDMTATALWQLARSHLGCDNCLVVMSRDGHYCKFDGDLGELYRSTFKHPGFNPRWEYGTCSHMHVLSLALGRVATVPHVSELFIGI